MPNRCDKVLHVASDDQIGPLWKGVRFMTGPTRYREVDVTGTPREMGRVIGEVCRKEIHGFRDVALERMRQTAGLAEDEAMRVAAESLSYAEAYRPEMVDELRGMAEGAEVSLGDLMFLQVRNQLAPTEQNGCTSISLSTGNGTTGGTRLLAQNWDADPALDEFTIVLTRRPLGKPAFINVTQAGLIAYIGLSEQGMGVCLNTLPAPSRRVGVPHYFTVRAIYESARLSEAVAAVESAQRAIPANIMLTTPDGPADLEVTLNGVRVLRPEVTSWIAHTNHCLHPELVAINSSFPELIDSCPRKSRVDELLSETSQFSPWRLMEILADHDRFPRSICRHTNDDPEHGFWCTVFSVVIDATDRVLYATRGNPCEQPYESYRLK